MLRNYDFPLSSFFFLENYYNYLRITTSNSKPAIKCTLDKNYCALYLIVLSGLHIHIFGVNEKVLTTNSYYRHRSKLESVLCMAKYSYTFLKSPTQHFVTPLYLLLLLVLLGCAMLHHLLISSPS